MFYLAKKMELTTFRGGKVSFAVEPEQHNNFLFYVYKHVYIFPITVIIALYSAKCGYKLFLASCSSGVSRQVCPSSPSV